MNSCIIYSNDEGGISIIIPAESVEAAMKDIPAGKPYKIVDVADVPSDRTFRGAWTYTPDGIKIDLARAKAIAHDIRRRRRAEELAPHDRVISLQIPGANTNKAEASRAAIRARYSAMQDAIDAASSPEEIKTALSPD